jgi:hypothetical protein
LTTLTDDLPDPDHFRILPIDKQEEVYNRGRAQHTNDPARQIMEVLMSKSREEERLTKEKERLTRELADTGRITGNDFCSRLQFIPTSKLPPLFNNDVSAEIINVTEELIEMPPEFWACHSFPQFKNPFFVGAEDTTEAVDQLVETVIHALIRIGYLPQDCILTTHRGVNLLGAEPKLACCWARIIICVESLKSRNMSWIAFTCNKCLNHLALDQAKHLYSSLCAS